MSLLADLHAHPTKETTPEAIIELLSLNITGLAMLTTEDRVLCYEDILTLPGVREIDKGLFAEISSHNHQGYAVKAQEVLSDHHILALGCHHYFPDYPDARQTVEEIHKQGGIAILNHPYIVLGKGLRKYRLITEKEEERVHELCDMVDEVEVFNAQCINLIPFIAWMKQANDKAKPLATKHGFKGTASSDAHFVHTYVKRSCIYVSEEVHCIDALKDAIKKGNFERLEQYVNHWEFFKAHVLAKYL